MPCDGIAVLTAETVADLEKYFAELLHCEQFSDWLDESGISNTHSWWDPRQGRALSLNVSGTTSLRFRGSSIQVVGRLPREETDQIITLAQAYAGQIAQQQVVEALAALGFTPQALSYTNDGELSFALNIGG